jgi:hypothetical protein
MLVSDFVYGKELEITPVDIFVLDVVYNSDLKNHISMYYLDLLQDRVREGA